MAFGLRSLRMHNTSGLCRPSRQCVDTSPYALCLGLNLALVRRTLACLLPLVSRCFCVVVCLPTDLLFVVGSGLQYERDRTLGHPGEGPSDTADGVVALSMSDGGGASLPMHDADELRSLPMHDAVLEPQSGEVIVCVLYVCMCIALCCVDVAHLGEGSFARCVDDLHALPAHGNDDRSDETVLNVRSSDIPDPDDATEKHNMEQVCPHCPFIVLISSVSAQAHPLSLICSSIAWRRGVARLGSRSAELGLLGGCRAASQLQHPHTRSKGYEYILVPGPSVLKDLLIHNGFDEAVLKPFEANVTGQARRIKWIENPLVAPDGCVRFRVTWTGKHAPSTVCCHQLNSAARYYVCTLLCFVIVVTRLPLGPTAFWTRTTRCHGTTTIATEQEIKVSKTWTLAVPSTSQSSR